MIMPTVSMTTRLLLIRVAGILVSGAAACSVPEFDGRDQQYTIGSSLPTSNTEGDNNSVRGAPQMPCTDKHTFVNAKIIRALEVNGWRLFTCSDDDVVFRRAALDPSRGAFEDPEELGIAKYARVIPGKKEQAAKKYRSPQSVELAKYMRSRFHIPKGRNDLRFDGVMADGRILASATVYATESSFCEFMFPDSPNPQTTCERVVGAYLIQLRSHSVNYGELERVLDEISLVVGN